MGRFSITDAQYKAFAPKWTNSPTEVTTATGSSTTSTQLTTGYYFVKATTDTYVKQGNSGVSAANTDWVFEGGVIHPMVVTGDSDDFIAGRATTDAGTLQILEVE